jgi:hypothetical protein
MKKKHWYELSAYQGWSLFVLMLLMKAGLLIWKGLDINLEVGVWDFMMGMFFMMGLMGDYK